MEVVAIEAVPPVVRGEMPSANPIAEQSTIQMAQLKLPAQQTGSNSSAYADLRPVAGPMPYDPRGTWSSLTRSIMDGTNQGILKPRIQELERAMEASAKDPKALPPERLAILMLKISQASAISNMLSTSVAAVRRSIATLVERTR